MEKTIHKLPNRARLSLKAKYAIFSAYALAHLVGFWEMTIPTIHTKESQDGNRTKRTSRPAHIEEA